MHGVVRLRCVSVQLRVGIGQLAEMDECVSSDESKHLPFLHQELFFVDLRSDFLSILI